MSTENTIQPAMPDSRTDKGVGCGELVLPPVGRDPQADALAPKHAHPAAIKPLRKLWAVCDPTGHIDHTTLSTRDDESIAAWMKTEQTLIPIFRGKPAQSWEVYEAEGYQVIQCDLTPSSQNTTMSRTGALPDVSIFNQAPSPSVGSGNS